MSSSTRNTFALSPFKVTLCLLIFATEECTTTTEEIYKLQKNLLANYISRVVQESLQERTLAQLKNELQELSPELYKLLASSLTKFC